jgi:class 3 adenylate cyclase
VAQTAEQAVQAAAAIETKLTGEQPAIDFGIGLATGQGVVAPVGGTHRFEYTVIGDVVNRAERLQELTRSLAMRVVCDAATGELARDTDSIGEHVLRRATEAIEVYTVRPESRAVGPARTDQPSSQPPSSHGVGPV